MFSDKEILIKIKNGEIDFFSFIVKKHTVSIFNFIKNKIKKHEDAEDIVQNVFVSLYKAINRFDQEKPIKPYLFQIVKNELKMFYRRHKPTLPLNEEIYIEEKEKNIYDEKILTSLKEKERDILLMCVSGYSYKEIARRLKKPINTVKSIIRRAREKARKYGKT